MSKAFTKESDSELEPEEPKTPKVPDKNLLTPQGFEKLQQELKQLLREERPKIVEIVSWAAGNGDRSENGDYIYGKKRLREIDRRVRYLTKQLEKAQVVDPALQQGLSQVFFGATVTYQTAHDTPKTIKIVGLDEADPNQNKISWLSPLAQTLLKAKVNDHLEMTAPRGKIKITVLKIDYILEQRQDSP